MRLGYTATIEALARPAAQRRDFMRCRALSDAGQFARAQKAFDDILAVGLALGGTVTGEHGIGKIKREWLAKEIGPVGLRVHRDVKRALDPENLFNPGSMFSMT